MLLQVISFICFQVVIAADFSQVIGDFEYIFHDNHNILLVLHNGSCFYSDVPDNQLMQAELIGQHVSDKLQQLVEQTIQGVTNSGTVSSSSLAEMMDRYGDRLADFHCLDKQVYHIDISLQLLTTTPPHVFPDCMDYVGLGKTCDMIPDVCNDIYGRLLCKKHCQLCNSTAGDVTPPPVSTVTPGECVDHVVNNPDLTCQRLPGVCTDSLAAAFCPKLCNKCVTTTVAPPTTTTTVATTRTAQQPCMDNLLYKHCMDIPNVCSDHNSTAQVVCRKTCGFCTDSSTTNPPLQQRPTDTCYDGVGHGVTCADIPGVCHDLLIGGTLCFKHCHCDCINNLVYDFQCENVPGVCGGPGRGACRRFCGDCHDTTTSTQPAFQTPPQDSCYDRVGNGVTCADLPGVCGDAVSSQVMCPKYCGGCVPQFTTPASTTPAPPCIDHMIYDFNCGNIPNVCGGPGRYACPKLCDLCTHDGTTDPPLQTPPQDPCYDRVGNGMTCADLPGACSDQTVSQAICPRYCGICVSTTPATTPAPPCINHVIYDYECNALPGICSGAGKYACANLCGMCIPNGATDPPLQTPPQDPCYDRVGNGIDCGHIPGVCNDALASQLLCPKHCHFCVSTTPATTTPAPPCINHVIYDFECNAIPGFCLGPGKYACPNLCGVCTPNGATEPPLQTPPQDPCYDRVGNGIHCGHIPGVCNDATASQLLCPKHCHFCAPATTSTTTTTTTTTPGPPCVNNVVIDFNCNQIPSVCLGPGAHACKRLCGICHENGATDPAHHPPAQGTTCYDRVGGGMTCADIPFVCSDTIASQIMCPSHCHKCASTTTASPTTTQPTTTNAQQCFDNVAHGLHCMADQCKLSYARIVCAKTCGFCGGGTTIPHTTVPNTPHSTLPPQPTTTHSTATPHTTTPHSTLPHSPVTTDTPATTHSTTAAATTTTATPCEDATGLGMDCGQLQATGFCHDAWSMMVCKKTCNHCSSSSTVPTNTLDPTATIVTIPERECKDHLINGVECSTIQKICDDAFGREICPRHCQQCGHTPSPTTPHTTTTLTHGPASIWTSLTTLDPTATIVTIPEKECYDHLINGMECSTVPNVCDDALGRIVCPRHCQQCGTTPTPCEDNVGLGMNCDQLQATGFCHDAWSMVVCRRTCNYCSSTSTVPTNTPGPVTTAAPACMDHSVIGITCTVQACADSYVAHTFCAMSCGLCVATTTPDPHCMDHIYNGMRCEDMPSICKDQYAKRLCPKYCGTCGQSAATIG